MWSKLALIFLCAALVLPLGAADPETKLTIEVTNHRGEALERASVVIKFNDGRSLKKLGKKVVRSFEMRTNQEGVATFPTIPQGDVLVMVIADHYQTFGETYTVNEEEKTLQIELLPPQQPYSAHQ